MVTGYFGILIADVAATSVPHHFFNTLGRISVKISTFLYIYIYIYIYIY